MVALLSGGIDSPVAAWRLMKRGCVVIPVHFHAFPLQDRTTIDKVTELARILTRYQLRTRLVLVPFAEVQQTIVDHILIVGNTRTDDRVIKRELLLQEGKPLGLEDLIESRQGIGYRLGGTPV